MAILNPKPSRVEEEIDLRQVFSVLKQGWLTILLFALVGGLLAGAYHFLYKPSYQAAAVISVDGSTVLSSTSPIFLIQSDSVQAMVVKDLSLSSDELQNVSFSADKTDKTIITITAETKNAERSVAIVNDWAEEAVKMFNGEDDSAKTELKNALKLIDKANTDLYEYLDQNGLSSLTWNDVVAITGAASLPGSLIDSSKEYPSLSVSQKMELNALVHQKDLAEWNYQEISRLYFPDTNTSTQRAVIINKAGNSEAVGKLSIYILLFLGILCGFLVAILWILIGDWWKTQKSVKN
jgi:hypothetical protein